MTKVYSNISDPDNLITVAKSKGLHVSGDGHTGIIQGYGVTISYEYSANNRALTLVILHKPLIISDSEVWHIVEENTGLSEL